MVLPVKILELEFTILEFYKDFVLSKIREGQVLDEKQLADLIEVCSEFYQNRPFAYLSYRIKEYNVNPVIYLNLDEVKNLRGIGIVCKNPSSVSTANFEKQFSKVPYEIFVQLNDAKEWARKIVSEKK